MCWLSVVALSSWMGAAQAQQFTVNQGKTELVDNVYQLDASLGYQFTPETLDALDNGVPLTLVLDIEVYRPRRYLWDEVIASLAQRYEIHYHALSDQYLLRHLNSGAQFTYPTLDSALASLGTVRNIPIIDAPLLEPGKHYMVRVRSRLDIDALPVPLQLIAYVSQDWWLSSGWYSWDL
jgi:hypothetical protein